jgi:predicted DsbA family dithiol-disulfide isomerase
MKEAFIGFAEEIGVDADEFNECVESDKFEEEIYSDMVDAQNAGIGATPSFVIDGKILVGAQPFEAFEKVIEEALGGL